MKLKLLLLASALWLCSCATVDWQSGPLQETPEIKNHQWRHSYLFGSLQSQSPLRITELCQDGSYESLRMSTEALQVFIAFVSLGIYTPYTLAAQCKTDGPKS